MVSLPAADEVEELFCRLGRGLRINFEQQRRHRDRRDRDEVALPGIGLALVDEGREQHRTIGADEQRVAVMVGFRESLARDHAAGTGLVVDDEGLAKPLLQLLGDDAGCRVDIAAGRIWHDQTDVTVGIGPSRHRACRESRDGNQRDGEKSHQILPWSTRIVVRLIVEACTGRCRPHALHETSSFVFRAFTCRRICADVVHMVDNGIGVALPLEPRKGAQAIRRAVAVLRILAAGREAGLPLAEVVQATGLTRPTVHRIVCMR
jgi:hypothetical protein